MSSNEETKKTCSCGSSCTCAKDQGGCKCDSCSK
ncbi:unnamed protein product [Candida parapsilosis]|uniref:Metallothionein n=1 Tax=Candida parapsilosis (strain CDC 317 / ATCC MYA-4646) TaxID=578454 RepID=G8B6F9_CANPC|nr:uncharacterized protein CPAR2_100780 [Candida parapsilosis]CAD1809388.1 unnamed protein product [Candida parapsilosis]CCE40040.1 hypothetical protein CPAR2_100780 [Candida parapsilosis]